jgi:uncharacterized FAD-dependent dehydrogenase
VPQRIRRLPVHRSLDSRLHALLSGEKVRQVVEVVAGIGRKGCIPECQLNNQGSNMFRISRFQELMKQIPRGESDRMGARHQADKYRKRFGSWNQLTATVYAQLADAQSLRQIQAGFNAQRTHRYHLGTHELKRSTLADANASRTPQVFA